MLRDPNRPRVSRETRRLLAAAGLALLALWILARLRFPERPSSQNPVSPVLTQISPPTTFADLAEEVERITQRIAPLLSEVTWQTPGQPGDEQTFPAWPWRDDLAIAMAPFGVATPLREDISAFDRPTGLALVQVSHPTRPAGGVIWSPDRLDVPRYLFAAAPAPSRPAVVPAYVSSLEPLLSPAWATEIWKVPAASGLPPGAFVFTAAGEWLGIATDERGVRVIVPAAALVDLAARLHDDPRARGGDLGIDVHDLTTSLAAAVGTHAGVIVAWVDPRGAAADALAPGDVIEAVNGQGVATLFAWEVHSTRLAAQAQAVLTVRRAGKVQDVAVTVPAAPEVRSGALGLSLAREPGRGARVTDVVPHTAADRAGLSVGDIVTMVGEHADPTPAAVRRAFDAIPDGGTVLLTLVRGTTHRLVALTR